MLHRSLPIFLVPLSLLSFANLKAQYPGSTAPPAELSVGFDGISPARAQEWLSILAGPRFEGRGTGQVGYTKAAHWVAGKAAEFGLDPMGDGGTYFQMLPMTRISIDPKESKLTGSGSFELSFEKKIGLERFTNAPEVQGKMAFVRLKGENLKPDETQRLRDRIVFFTCDENAASQAGQWIVRQRPAAMFRVIDKEPISGSQLQREGGRQRATSPSGTMARSAVDSLLGSIDGSKEWIKPLEKNDSIVELVEQTCTLKLRYREEQASVPNVIAYQPGADANLRHEYVVIGAHLDHLGNRDGAVYPGADDNGSGSTALLSIARAISENPIKPKRSILMIWFAAEEIGLVGSAYYCDHPILPIENMVCMLNVDMVGRNEEKQGESAEENERTIHLIGSQKGNKSLHELILDANRYVNFSFEFDEESVFGRSDQANFFKKGTSVAFLFGGFHPDYHRPSDLPEKINFHKIASAAKLFYITAHFASQQGPLRVPTEQAR